MSRSVLGETVEEMETMVEGGTMVGMKSADNASDMVRNSFKIRLLFQFLSRDWIYLKLIIILTQIRLAEEITVHKQIVVQDFTVTNQSLLGPKECATTETVASNKFPTRNKNFPFWKKIKI